MRIRCKELEDHQRSWEDRRATVNPTGVLLRYPVDRTVCDLDKFLANAYQLMGEVWEEADWARRVAGRRRHSLSGSARTAIRGPAARAGLLIDLPGALTSLIHQPANAAERPHHALAACEGGNLQPTGNVLERLAVRKPPANELLVLGRQLAQRGQQV